MYIRIIIILMAATVGLSESKSEVLAFEPGMIVQLGSTFDPFAPYEAGALGNCLNTVITNEAVVSEETYTEGFVNTFSEYLSKTGVSLSASGSGSYGLAKASAAIEHKEEREIFNQNTSIVYLVSGTRTYNPKKLQSAKLNEFGEEKLKTSIDTEDPSEFYRTCGLGLISSVTKETNISIAYVFETSDAKKIEAIKSTISANASYGAAKGKASVNMTEELRKIDNSINLNVRIYQSGVLDNQKALNSIVGETPGDLPAVRKNLKDAINEISWESSQIKSFTVDRMSRHFNIPKYPDFRYVTRLYNQLDNAKKNAEQLVKRYLQLSDVLDNDGLRGLAIKPGMREVIINNKDDIEDQLDDLVDTIQLCFDNKDKKCKVRTIDIDSGILDYLQIDYGSFNTWFSNASGGYDSAAEQIRAHGYFYPVFTIKNEKYIESFEFIQDNNVTKLYLNNQLINQNLNNSVLSLSQLKYDTRYDKYCWRGVWGTQCTPWASDTARHKNYLKENFRGTTFKALITDIEGNEHVIEVPQISSINYN